MINKCGMVLVLICVTACTSVPLSTMWKLRSMSPLETRAEDLSVAIRSPKAINLNSAKTGLEFGYQWSEAENDRLVEYFELSLVPTRLLPESISKNLTQGEQAHILKLDERDHARFYQAQQKIKKLKEKYPDGNGWFNVGLSQFCLKELSTEQELLVNIYLQTEKFSDYMLLIRNLNVGKKLNWEEAQCEVYGLNGRDR